MPFVAPKEKIASFDTPLNEAEEAAFQTWKTQIAPNDSGYDYDLRGAYKAGLAPGADGHWPDTYKKPNHPTFSNESIYAKLAPALAGSWKGNQFIAPGAPTAPAQGFVAPSNYTVADPAGVADDFDEITFAAENAANPRSVDFAYKIYADRAKRGFKDATGNPYKHYKPSMTIGDVASGFGSFVRGTAMAVPRLIKQAGQAAIDSPNAATTTAENIVGVQMAGKNFERLTNTEPVALEVLPEPVVKSPLGVLLDSNGKAIAAELEKVKAAIGKSDYSNQVKQGAANAVVSIEGGMRGELIPDDQIEDLERIMQTSHPERAAAAGKASEEAELRQNFDNALLRQKEALQLAKGQPIDRGIVADAIKNRAGEGVATSELFSPEALRNMGAAPVDVDAARAVAAAADPANLALVKAPGLPFARKAGGALAAGIGKTLEGVGALGGKARPALRAAGVGAGVLALAQGNPETAAAIGAALAGRWGLRKVGELGRFMTAAGKEAMTGAASPTMGALANARRAGNFAPGLTAKAAAQNAIIDAAAMPVGALPVNALMSHGDMETFWAMEAGSPLFGLFGAVNPIKPQLVNAIRPQLRAEGKARFETYAKGDKWDQASQAMVAKLPQEQQNAVYEITAVLSGLDTGGGQQSDIVPLSAADYAAFKAENGLGAGNDRGVTHNGKAYINAEHASAKTPGELAHTVGHETGGHVAGAILRASTDKGGLLYDKTVAKIKGELGKEENGKFTPTPEFAEFIKQYNAALVKGGSPKEAQIAPNDPIAVEEWIAETAGGIFREGGGNVAIPEGLRDKIGNAIGKLFGENLGIEGNFGHKENAKITSAWMDALRQISDPAVRRMTRADSPAQEEPGAPEPNIPPQPALDPLANARRDAELALVALGWPRREAAKAAFEAQGNNVEELVKSALGSIAAKPTPPPVAPTAPVPAPEPQIQATAPPTGALVGGIKPAEPATKPALAPETPVAVEAPPQTAEQMSLEARNKAAADLAAQLGRGALAGGIKPAESPVAPAKAPEVANPAETAIETALAKAGKKGDKARLPVMFDIATQIAQNDPALFQKRTDEKGRVKYSGRLNFDLPEHRALAKELGWSPEETARIKQAQESAGKVSYVDYYSAENLDPGDITGAQRKTEYEADKQKASRSELQKNKAIIFTNVTAFPKGKAIQRGISVDKYLANAAKLLRAAKEHNLGVDYTDINDPNLLEDLNGYVENHQNGYKGDGSGPVKGETPAEGYEPYLIPRSRFDLLNAAFHIEGSTASARLKARQAAHAADVAAWEAGGKKGRKPTKPSLRAETREAEADTQALARENDWPVDEATGDTNPFRAFLNREGKLEFKNPETGALRKGTTENLESVFEALSPDMIAAIRDTPNGPQETVRGVGFTGDTGGVLSKGLPKFDRVAAGFMPDTPVREIQPGRYEVTDKSKFRNDVIKANRVSDKYQGGSAWLSPDLKWIKVNIHQDAFPYRMELEEGTVQDLMESAGFIRIATEGDTLYANEGNPTPRQLKEIKDSAIERKMNPDIRLMPDTGGFYSQLERVAEQKIKGRATPEQIRATLKNNGVKDDELNWVLGDLLARKQGGQITPEELRQEIAANRVELKEKEYGNVPRGPDGKVYENTQKGLDDLARDAAKSEDFWAHLQKEGAPIDDFDAFPNDVERRYEITSHAEYFGSENPKFGQYQLPGGANYKELVYSLPIDTKGLRVEKMPEGTAPKSGDLQVVNEEGRVVAWGYANEAAAMQGIARLKGGGEIFKSSHFDEPNIIFHTRVNDRQTADGQSMLFAEEVQSDAHQLGRKHGYKGEKPFIEINSEKDMLDNGFKKVKNPQGATQWFDQRDRFLAGSQDPDTAYRTARPMAEQVLNDQREAIPNLPFKGEGWKRLALKKLLARAVQEGKESIGWTTGAQQAARYDLSKHFHEISAREKPNGQFEIKGTDPNGRDILNTTVEPNKLEDTVGKELAGKILDAAKEKRAGYRSLNDINSDMVDVAKAAGVKKGIAPGWRPNGGEFEDLYNSNPEFKKLRDEWDATTRVDWTPSVFSGLDLKIGGEGMKGFYDRELVNIANDLGKKYGARVQKTNIQTKRKDVSKARARDFDPDEMPLEDFEVNTDGELAVYEGNHGGYVLARDEEGLGALPEVYGSRDEAVIALREHQKNAPETAEVWQLPITPELKKAVAGGQALFMPDAKGRENTPDRTVRSNARVMPGALGEGIKKPKGALEEGLRKR